MWTGRPFTCNRFLFSTVSSVTFRHEKTWSFLKSAKSKINSLRPMKTGHTNISSVTQRIWQCVCCATVVCGGLIPWIQFEMNKQTVVSLVTKCPRKNAGKSCRVLKLKKQQNIFFTESVLQRQASWWHIIIAKDNKLFSEGEFVKMV